MQFTPQQMKGGARFSSVTLIGNWMEEISLEETKLAEFRAKSAGGQLHLRKQQGKAQRCNQQVLFN
jgi:hypothetical protein